MKRLTIGLNPLWLVAAVVVFAACMLLGCDVWLALIIAVCWTYVAGAVVLGLCNVADWFLMTRWGMRLEEWVEAVVEQRRRRRRARRGRNIRERAQRKAEQRQAERDRQLAEGRAQIERARQERLQRTHGQEGR